MLVLADNDGVGQHVGLQRRNDDWVLQTKQSLKMTEDNWFVPTRSVTHGNNHKTEKAAFEPAPLMPRGSWFEYYQ